MKSYSKKGKKISNEEFDLRILNSDFTRVDDYINTKTSIKFKCKKCDKVFKKKPKEFNKLKCDCNKRGEKYIKTLNDKGIKLLENYTNMRDSLLHECNTCENIFKSSPKSIKSSLYGCPVCSGKKFNLKKYKELLPNDILVEDNYINTNTKINHKCVKCGSSWKTKPNYILHMGTGCPNCSSSKGEKIISDILSNVGINYIKEHSVKIKESNYRFDFYLPDYGIYIEYDGIQHFKPIEYFGGEDYFMKIKESDRIKSKWVLDNEQVILRIPYTKNSEVSILEHIMEHL